MAGCQGRSHQSYSAEESPEVTSTSQQRYIRPQEVPLPLNSCMTVLDALRQITGVEPLQKDLIIMREGIFGDILPKLTRIEKRDKRANLRTFEQYGAVILPLLKRDVVFLWIEFELREVELVEAGGLPRHCALVEELLGRLLLRRDEVLYLVLVVFDDAVELRVDELVLLSLDERLLGHDEEVGVLPDVGVDAIDVDAVFLRIKEKLLDERRRRKCAETGRIEVVVAVVVLVGIREGRVARTGAAYDHSVLKDLFARFERWKEEHVCHITREVSE